MKMEVVVVLEGLHVVSRSLGQSVWSEEWLLGPGVRFERRRCLSRQSAIRISLCGREEDPSRGGSGSDCNGKERWRVFARRGDGRIESIHL